MTDELKHAASVLCRCQYLDPDALVMHGGITMLAWESRVPFVKAVLAALADNLPDAMVEAGARAHCDHFGGEGWYSSGQAADSTEAMNAAMRLTLTAALNVKEG